MVFILLVRKAFGCAVFAEQMARNARFVAALILQGTAVETAGGDLRLMEPFAVKHDLLGTGLAGEEVAVGLSVIEDIPFPAHKGDAPVGVAAVVEGFSIAVDADIGIGYQYAAEVIIAQRGIRHGPAQFVHPAGRVDEVVFPVDLAHGAGLKERVRLILGAVRVIDDGEIVEGAGLDSDHVLLQFHFQAVLVHGGLLIARAVAGKEIDASVVIDKDAGIELTDLIGTRAENIAVRIAHKVEELIGPGRFVRDGHADFLEEVQAVIEVVLSVVPAADIRCPQGVRAVRVAWILRLAENDAFIAPVREIVFRGGPADIVVGTVDIAVKAVVAAIDVETAVKHTGFAVRDVLIAGKIGIEHLLFHGCFSSSSSIILPSAF